MTSYTIRVEWTDTTNAAARAGTIVDELGPTAAVGVSAELADGRNLPWTATVTVDATTPRGAASKAVGLVESATGIPADGFEVLTTVEHDRRAAHPQFPQLVGNTEIADMLGVTRQRVVQLVKLDNFPPAVVTTRGGSLRVLEQVEAWARAWERRSGRPPRETVDA